MANTDKQFCNLQTSYTVDQIMKGRREYHKTKYICNEELPATNVDDYRPRTILLEYSYDKVC